MKAQVIGQKTVPRRQANRTAEKYFFKDILNKHKRKIKEREQKMTDKVIENNQAVVIGTIVSDFTYSHEIFGEAFYMVDVEVERLSYSSDIIPVMISERLINVEEDYKGSMISVSGQFRSYNRHEEKKNRLILSVFAREVEFIDHVEKSAEVNQIYLEGYICKEPVYRKTPLGREIADLLLAVNRLYGRTDYISCICWGRNARFSDGLSVGTRIRIWGRVQSREYIKKINEEQTEKRVAYEVSIIKMEVSTDEEENH